MDTHFKKVYQVRRFATAAAIAALVALLISSVCAADVMWTTNGVELRGTGVSNSADEPQIASDGSGGAIVTWQDQRSGSQVDIYAQRIDSTGVVQWTANGVELRGTGVSYAVDNHQITADGLGGAIVTWEDLRSGSQVDIYAQRINSTGTVQWTANGVELRGAGVSNSAYKPQITSDGSGGAIVTWRDYRSGSQWDIYAQRIDSTGAVQWTTNGVELRGTGASFYADNPQITSDGSGGAIVTWRDIRSGSQEDIYAQRIDSTGAVQWTTNGVELRGTGVSYDAYNPQITEDGSGGAVVTWRDYRSGSQYDIYAQGIDSTGAVQWTANGVELRGTGVSSDARYPQITPDGSGGAVVTWDDYRSGSRRDIYAQRIDSTGAVQWTANGVELRGYGLSNNARYPQITEDGSGGAVVTWEDYRSGSQWDIYAQRIDSMGAVQWTANGVELRGTGASYDAYDPQITAGGLGGAVVTWDDYRSGSQYDIYAQKVLCPSTPTVTGITPGSGEFGTTVSVTDLAGTGFYKNPTVKLKKSGAVDIDASDVTVVSPTQITCSFDIPWGTTLGDWDVYVENLYGKNYTLSNGFTMNAPAPTVTGITPETGNRGTTVSVTDLSGTNFFGTPTVRLKKTGETDIDASDVSVVSPTQITCSFDLPEGSALGDWDLYVENPDGQSDTLACGFTVIRQAPTVTGVTPESGKRGTTVSVTDLSGTNFFGTPTVRLKKTGETDINASDVSVVSPTQITCSLDLPEGSALGDWDLYVENPDGQNDTLACGFSVVRQAPTVTGVTPQSGNRGTTVSVTDLSGTNFFGTPIVKLKKTGETDINASEVSVVSPTQINCSFDLPWDSALGDWDVYVENPDGQNDTLKDAFSVTNEIWYLAEGTTAWGFDTYITIENPNDEEAEAEITYNTKEGPVSGGRVTLPPMSQTTVNPEETLGEKDFSTEVELLEGKRIAVDRTMSWTGEGAASPEGHCSIGVTSKAKTWYLPEGSSAWGFECWLLIQNPNEKSATAQITYMLEGAGPVTVEKEIPANSRRSYNMADDIGQRDASIKVESDIPVIPERAMYRNNKREGHESIGTITPADDYYLAEGAVGYDSGFETYVLVQNPNNEPTDVGITFLTGTGEVEGPAFSMEPNSRKTIKANDYLPPESDLSTHVHGSKPIIAERAMYWNTPTGEVCHDSIGMAGAHKTFYMPDGQTSQGRETWTLISNSNNSDVKVRISYLSSTDEGTVTFEEIIPANSRKSFNMKDRGVIGRAAVLVESLTDGKNIMCERSMYWNSRGAGTNTIGGYND